MPPTGFFCFNVIRYFPRASKCSSASYAGGAREEPQYIRGSGASGHNILGLTLDWSEIA